MEEIQSNAERKDMPKFHDEQKTVYGPKSSAHGRTLLIDKYAILKMWTEHFGSELNRPSTINDNSIICHRWGAIYCLINSELSLKQGKQISICLRAKPLVQSCFTASRERRLSHKNSRMNP